MKYYMKTTVIFFAALMSFGLFAQNAVVTNSVSEPFFCNPKISDSRLSPFIEKLKDYTLRNKGKKVAKLISFPISVEFENGDKQVITNMSFFTLFFNRIFTQKLRAQLLEDSFKPTGCDKDRVIFGNGAISIAHKYGKLKISTINTF